MLRFSEQAWDFYDDGRPEPQPTRKATMDMNLTTLRNTADWHAHQAIKAYRKRDYDAYRRHLCIADDLRSAVVMAWEAA